eukprot:CAMPEP_0198121574 /NCGR_PEP_ID=MMETSP1442-20131203/32489_1 /TAXON_ID= /ORGANISM="Craspedostauros australis, Strain CCMP3328" /LENGTH=238 /DNA_ID=CAMNT_0043780413 /DNA_START=51 /DNA_END=767 /DNA_ORIENTATION=+
MTRIRTGVLLAIATISTPLLPSALSFTARPNTDGQSRNASSARRAAASFQETDTPPLLNVPTYSVATLNADGTTNMNILSYAIPTSSRPDRIWTLGVYKGTLTETNVLREGTCVLQLLTEEHANLVPLLGGTCGRDVDKAAVCSSKSMPFVALPQSDAPMVLPRCGRYLLMTVDMQQDVVDGGSHWILNCKVERMWEVEDGTAPHLMGAKLRELGIISPVGRVSDEAKEEILAELGLE